MITSGERLYVSIDSGTTWVDLTPYLLDIKWEWNKGWGSDTGRNLKGTFSGTFIGVFPKITPTFGPLTKNELDTLAPILDSKRQKIKYYDPNKHTQKIIDTYTGDWNNTQQNLDKIDQSFSISFIATKVRS